MSVNQDRWSWHCYACEEEICTTRGLLTEEQDDQEYKCHRCGKTWTGYQLIGTNESKFIRRQHQRPLVK